MNDFPIQQSMSSSQKVGKNFNIYANNHQHVELPSLERSWIMSLSTSLIDLNFRSYLTNLYDCVKEKYNKYDKLY